MNFILRSLNGHGTEVDSLRAALLKLRSDRDDRRRELAELRVRRHQSLLDDVSDDALAKLDRQIERKQVQINKFDLAEPEVRERLAAAEGQARKDAEPGFVAEYREAFEDYAASLRRLADAHRRQTEIRDRARATLGEARTALLLPPFAYAGVLTHGEVSMWFDRNVAELRASGGARPVEGRPPPAAKKAVRTAPSMSVVSLAFTPACGTLTARRAPDDNDPLLPGEARVTALQNGWTPRNDREQCHAGQKLRMPAEAAREAARRGLVEIIEEARP